jgi:lysophospholipase L1-like esterase
VSARVRTARGGAAGGLLRKIALSAATAALCLAFVEIAIRVLDLRVMGLHRGMQKLAALEVFHPERRILTGPASTHAIVLGHDTWFNSLGMRDVEPVVPNPPGRYRILVLGDSMVFGQGVAQDHMVAEVLRDRLGNANLDVVSAGIPGWRTIDQEQFLLEHLDRLAPDLVTLVYVENDNEPYDPFQREKKPPERTGEAIYRYLLVHSRAFEWAIYVYRSRIAGPAQGVLDEVDRWNALVAAQGPAFAPNDPGWIASRDALVRMQRVLAEKGARLVVFLYDLGTIASDAPIRDRLAEVAASDGIRIVETRPFFAGHPRETLVNSLDDPHPNKLGHELLGAGMARTLVELGYLERSQLRDPGGLAAKGSPAQRGAP